MAFGKAGTIHPDENLLTAFAEQTLAPSERQNVLEHLSSCRHCRDVVFLAQQAAAEEETQAAPVADKSLAGGWWLGRRHWGMVLAGGALAAMLIVTSLRLYELHRAPVSPPPAVAGARAPVAPTENEAAATSNAPTSSPVKKESRQRAPVENAPLRDSENQAGASAASPAAGSSKKESREQFRLEMTPPHVTVVGPPNIPSAPPAVAAVGAGTGVGRGAGIGAAAGGGVRTNGAGSGGGIGSGNGGNAGGGTYRAGAANGVAGGIGGLAPAAPQAQAKAKASGTTNIGTVTLEAGSATQSVQVTSAQPLLQTANAEVSMTFTPGNILPGGNGFTVRDGVAQKCVAGNCLPVKSPSKAQVISVASGAGTVMAVDVNGDLFLSHNEGRHWKKEHVQWQGRAREVRAMAQVPSHDAAAAAASSDAVSAVQPPVLQPNTLQIFQLQNEQGQLWLSSDEGKTWRLK